MHPYFFVRADRQCVKIRFDQLICVESKGNYVNIITETHSYLSLLSLRQLENVLPYDLFCRISRSCIVSLDHIISFDREAVTLTKNKNFSFGDGYRLELEMRVNILISDVRNKAAEKFHIKSIDRPHNNKRKKANAYQDALN